MVLFTVFKQFDARPATGAGYVGYSDFLEEVRNNHIKSAVIMEGQSGTEIVAVTSDDRRIRTTAIRYYSDNRVAACVDRIFRPR